MNSSSDLRKQLTSCGIFVESRHLFITLDSQELKISNEKLNDVFRWGRSGVRIVRTRCRTRSPGSASSICRYCSRLQQTVRSTCRARLERNYSRLENNLLKLKWKLLIQLKYFYSSKMAQQLNLDIDDKFIRTLKSVTQVSLSSLSLSLTEMIRSLEWVWGTAPWQTVASSTFSSSIWRNWTFSLANNSRYAELSLQGKLKEFLMNTTNFFIWKHLCEICSVQGSKSAEYQQIFGELAESSSRCSGSAPLSPARGQRRDWGPDCW